MISPARTQPTTIRQLISLRSRKRLDANEDTRLGRLLDLLHEGKGTLRKPEDRAAVEALLTFSYTLGSGQFAQEHLILSGYTTEQVLTLLENLARFGRLAGTHTVVTPTQVARYLIAHPRG